MTEIIISLVILVVAVAIFVEHKRRKIGVEWKMVEPTKKGGSFSIYYKDKHIANIRGKMKAMVLIHAIKGVDLTDKLDMEVVKPVVKKKVVKKAVKKPVAKKVVKKKVKK